MFDDTARLRLLHELGMAFASHTDLDDLCRLVIAKCGEVLGAEGASILLLDESTNELYFPYVANTDPQAAARLRAMRFPADRGIAGHTLSTGEAVRLDDAEHDERIYRGADARSGSTTRNLLAAPLRCERGIVGVLQVVNRVGGGSFRDDDLRFLESIAGSVAVAVENARLLAETRAQLEALRRATEEHAALEALQRELDIAREIQQAILPSEFPCHSALELYATMVPARDVGGDFYDFFWLDPHRLGLVIGDVSGKGIGAAFFMAVSRTLMKAAASGGNGPAACLSHVNRLLLADNPSDMFVTLCYAILDVDDGRLVFCNGGHNPPLLQRHGASMDSLQRTGPLLGVLEEARFAEASCRLDPGDSLLFYTDGVTEAADATGTLYGEERLRQLLHAAEATPPAVAGQILAAVHAHAGDTPQSDDITLLALRFRGPLAT